MKKILSGLSVAMFFLISCNNPASPTSADSGSANEVNIANNNKIYKALETGDVAPLDTLIASDCIEHDAPGGGEIKGKDSVMNMLANLHNRIRNFKIDVITNAVNGDYVFSLIHITGTTDSSMGMAANNIDEKAVDVMKFNNHKITDHWGFTEDAAVYKEMMDMRNQMGDMGKKKK